MYIIMSNPPILHGTSLSPSQRISKLLCDIEGDTMAIERGQSAMAISQYTCEVIKTAVQVTRFNFTSRQNETGIK